MRTNRQRTAYFQSLLPIDKIIKGQEIKQVIAYARIQICGSWDFQN